MTDNSFNLRIANEVVPYLEKLCLLKSNIYKPENHSTDSVREIAREGKYEDIFYETINTYSYDMLLVDDSIFQFHKEQNDYRYCFIQSPRVKMTWEEFLESIDTNEEELSVAEIEQWHSYYDNDEADCYRKNIYPVYMRYDVSAKEYKEGEHPYSHLHIGINNEIRIPIALVLTPEMFTEFVIKMVYKKQWADKKNENYFVDFHKTLKRGCEPIQLEFWSEIDKLDIFIK